MLIGTEIVEEFICTVLLTGRLDKVSPVSAVLIAEPENGKTSIVLNRPSESALVVSRTTAKGLETILQTHREVSHIILTDLTYITGMGPRASKNLISYIMAMTEEGIRVTADPGGINLINARKGIIACMTPAMAKDSRNWWWKHGLARRLVPFHYALSRQLVLRIKDVVMKEQDLTWRPGAELAVPKASVKVELSDLYAKAIREISDRKASQLRLLGISLLKQFIALAKAHTLMHCRWSKAAVSDAEIEFLRRIYPYVDWEIPAEIGVGVDSETRKGDIQIPSKTVKAR
jgi:hypothetical protein